MTSVNLAYWEEMKDVTKFTMLKHVSLEYASLQLWNVWEDYTPGSMKVGAERSKAFCIA